MSRRLKAGALWRGLGQDSPEPHPLGAQAWGLRRAPLSRADKRLGRTPFAQQRLRLRPLWLVDPSPQARQLAVDLQKVSTTSDALSTAALCRQLLLDSITQPELLPTPTLVARLLSVTSAAGRASAR